MDNTSLTGVSLAHTAWGKTKRKPRRGEQPGPSVRKRSIGRKIRRTNPYAHPPTTISTIGRG
jgi:hypothetical protein